MFLLLQALNKLNIEEVSGQNTSYHNFSRIQNILLQINFTEEQINHTICQWNSKTMLSFINPEMKINSETWTYFNAFIFAFHVCSTIGYGDVAPATNYGQLLCMLYAIIGIPLNILFFKTLGDAYSDAYQEIIWKVNSDDTNKKKQVLAHLIFYIPWVIIFMVLPSVVFMYTEDWNFLDGLYYSFITLTTVGLGDYVAGENLPTKVSYVFYRIALLCWMMHGLAFVSMVVDFLAHQYQKICLYRVSIAWDKFHLSIRRVYMDIEKLDIHFRLFKTEQVVNQRVSMWAVSPGTKKAAEFQRKHVHNILEICDKLQSSILNKLMDMEGGEDILTFQPKEE
ncbi:potassium channel subfamily K member 16-like [Stegodyphus dumicola]|uniref:potassium channel subfamily K member 16-like n=1 Tax=Stegodyphus dumicola TaxID=202533 RepID=UPI0015AA2749|nr:potassium channel subfamily K member 16-like [Stegodyphus dumicola]